MKRLIIGFCLLLLSGCSSFNNENRSLIFNDKLYSAYHHVGNSLTLKRTSLLFSDGSEADNCLSYDKLIKKSNVDESVNNQQVKSEYLICDALDILPKSNFYDHKKNQNLYFGKTLLSRLDLRSFPSSLNRKSRGEFHTLKQLYPNQVSSSGEIARLQTKNWNVSLEVVAVTYINDNKDPDLIVWVSDESRLGNYYGYSTIIVYDVDKPGLLKASAFPVYLQ